MHESASNGVVGDVSRDGTPLSSRVCVSDQLRNLADWLDAHPQVQVSTVSFMDVRWDGVVKVFDYGHGSLEAVEARAKEIGGQWSEIVRETYWEMQQAIMPGFALCLVAAKPQSEDVAA